MVALQAANCGRYYNNKIGEKKTLAQFDQHQVKKLTKATPGFRK
jgi:hypothetical protein